VDHQESHILGYQTGMWDALTVLVFVALQYLLLLETHVAEVRATCSHIKHAMHDVWICIIEFIQAVIQASWCCHSTDRHCEWFIFTDILSADFYSQIKFILNCKYETSGKLSNLTCTEFQLAFAINLLNDGYTVRTMAYNYTYPHH
jgi:hypothetical protein